ncbi:hypothetical protein [uncultured Paracoccus sp.]|uniref:hypothetical protein n=1 Tax=uncultured Paracoccus sp. TaxID=189685 RepID=UPI0025E3A11C|nr:hypothetical protein [uncultured Paracoccus sp.]
MTDKDQGPDRSGITADHARIMAGLKSDDWQRRLDAARAQRARIVAQPDSGQAPSSAAEAPRRPGKTLRVAAAVALSVLTGWLLLGCAAPPETSSTAVRIQPVEQAALPPAERLRHGPDIAIPALSHRDFPAAPAPPPSTAQMLARLGEIVSAGTRVHLPHGIALQHAPTTLSLIRSRFATPQNLVRYHHDDDRDLATRAAVAIGGQAVDFTTYASAPAPGTAEI